MSDKIKLGRTKNKTATDAALGRAIRKGLGDFAKTLPDKELGIVTLSAQILCAYASKVNSTKTDITLEELNYEGKDIGNWKLTVEKTSAE